MNDIEEQERTLGAMIAAAKSRGLGWCKGAFFRNSNGESVSMNDDDVASCCARGAMDLAELSSPELSSPGGCASYGNDENYLWSVGSGDYGESLGWAFRQAMTEDDQ